MRKIYFLIHNFKPSSFGPTLGTSNLKYSKHSSGKFKKGHLRLSTASMQRFTPRSDGFFSIKGKNPGLVPHSADFTRYAYSKEFFSSLDALSDGEQPM
ncbi:MAG: hypothetical protein SFU98_09715 [Leptospiraceae bacterium]|nr:hypothetical protein [Leptospiraceae bacterium]